MKPWKRKVLNFLLKHLFNTVTEDQFLKVTRLGHVFEGTKPIPSDEAKELSSQAQSILRYPVYKKLSQSLQWKANELMYLKSKSDQDIVFGKAILWALDIFQKKLEALADISKKK